jgi:hypothetical protein
MRTVAYGLLIVGTLFWFVPFLLVNRNNEAPQKLNPRARWGILLVAYSLLWQNSFWARPLSAGRIAISTIFLALAALLSWTAHARLDVTGVSMPGLAKTISLCERAPIA